MQTLALGTAGTLKSYRGAVHRFARIAVFATFLTSSLVLAEPAPFDALMLGLCVLLPAIGLTRISGGLLVFLALNFVIVGAGVVAATQSFEPGRSLGHCFVSLYLAVAAFVVAAFVAQNPLSHARLIANAWMAAALVAATAAIIGYGDLIPGAADVLTLYGRASGTFKDPNVLGPFLAPAALIAVDRALSSRPLQALALLALAALLALGVLLTFSRGAWFVLAAGFGLYAWLACVTTSNAHERLTIISGAGLALALGAAVILVALQNDGVRDLVENRASLTQAYDIGPEGRFGGQDKAVALILEHPLGIGAQQFSGVYHHEEVHNVYLSMMLNAGWLGGLISLALMLLTVAAGARSIVMLPAGPVRRLAVVALAAFLPQAIEGLVIDSDHWRHVSLLMALIWGLANSLGAPKSAWAWRPPGHSTALHLPC